MTSGLRTEHEEHRVLLSRLVEQTVHEDRVVEEARFTPRVALIGRVAEQMNKSIYSVNHALHKDCMKGCNVDSQERFCRYIFLHSNQHASVISEAVEVFSLKPSGLINEKGL